MWSLLAVLLGGCDRTTWRVEAPTVPMPDGVRLAVDVVLPERTPETGLPIVLTSVGENTRWTAGLLRPVEAPDRADAPGLLSFRTAPLDATLATFGAGALACEIGLSPSEAALHVYLEAVDARGRVRLLTEGGDADPRRPRGGAAPPGGVRARRGRRPPPLHRRRGRRDLRAGPRRRPRAALAPRPLPPRPPHPPHPGNPMTRTAFLLRE